MEKRKTIQQRAANLARGNPRRSPAAPVTRRGRGIPLVGNLDSPGAPGSGIAGAGAVEEENRLQADGRGKRKRGTR